MRGSSRTWRGARSLLLAGAALVLLATPGPATAKGGADLALASLSNPPRSVERTGGFDVSFRIRNAGGGKAGASTTGFYLSPTRRKSGRAIRLRPGQAVAKLKGHAALNGTIALVVPGGARLGSYYLIACADVARRVAERNEANNCRSSSRRLKVVRAVTPPRGKSSADLIDAAVRAHRISVQVGTLYKVLAEHKDPRLPPEYRGSVFGGFDESSLMMDAAQHLRSYSPAVQAELKPFFVPPYYSASWWAIQRGKASSSGSAKPAAGGPRCNFLSDWDHLDTTDGNFRIWWEAGSTRDAARAASMGSDLKGTIFPKLAGLMAPGKSDPLEDSGGVCRGGSGAFDIALTGVDGAETVTDSFGCSATSSHMNVPGAATPTATPTNRDTLAHELMHAFQYKFPTDGGCDEYRWLREATAQWAMDFVYPSDNAERGAPGNPTKAIDAFFRDPAVPLETRDGVHEYGAYLYFLFLSKTMSPNTIRAVWAAAGSNADSLKAVDDVVHFKDAWPTFAVNNWNRAPFDFYNMWDAPFTEGPHRSAVAGVADDNPIDMPLDGNGNAIFAPNLRIGHLGIRYFDFQPSSGVRSLAFNSLMVDPGHIEALVRIGGAWRDDGDWSSPATPKFFCRDFSSERVNEVVLVAGNSSYDRSSVLEPANNPPPTLAGTNVDCHKWVGSFSGTYHQTGGIDRTETWSGNATFERQPGSLSQSIPVTSSAITWSMTQTIDGCTYTAGPVTLTNNIGDFEIPGPYTVYDPRAYRIFLAGSTQDIPAHVACQDGSSGDYTEHARAGLETSGHGASERHEVDPGGGTGDGTSSQTDVQGATTDWHWNFSPA